MINLKKVVKQIDYLQKVLKNIQKYGSQETIKSLDWPIIQEGEKLLKLLEPSAEKRSPINCVMVGEDIRNCGFESDKMKAIFDLYKMFLNPFEYGELGLNRPGYLIDRLEELKTALERSKL